MYYLFLLINSAVILKYCAQPVYTKVDKNRLALRQHTPVGVLLSLSEVSAVGKRTPLKLGGWACGLTLGCEKIISFQELLASRKVHAGF